MVRGVTNAQGSILNSHVGLITVRHYEPSWRTVTDKKKKQPEQFNQLKVQ